ncbi:MAG: hypothetical protein HFH41_08435 [Lachnospiraceae bacterium]|nr:hypothetical protein [Lachnospiraceae bacterium]
MDDKKDVKVTPVKEVTSTKPAEKAVAAEAKTAETKKTVAKPVEEPKKETAKKETVKQEAPAKKTVKRTTTKKTEAKKTEKIEEIYLQFHGKEIFTKDVMERAKQAYISEGHRESSIKSIRLYIKPEENMAYYVINEKIAGGVTL